MLHSLSIINIDLAVFSIVIDVCCVQSATRVESTQTRLLATEIRTVGSPLSNKSAATNRVALSSTAPVVFASESWHEEDRWQSASTSRLSASCGDGDDARGGARDALDFLRSSNQSCAALEACSPGCAALDVLAVPKTLATTRSCAPLTPL